MTIKQLFETGLIKDNDEIWIRNGNFHTLAHGNWYQDNILDYLDSDVSSFTWQDDEKLYIDVE